MAEIFAFLAFFSYLCRSNRDANNPIYSPLKHNDYEQNMEDNSEDSRVRHQFPADKGQRSED